ncbi:hypothetical protein AAFF_G00424750 [Aldrovandia affinis]|uniref:Uncharacterized protein n=1 Tax=Aldrovandia affinis TaxID=143900 RepID=A0AAD7T705_9TELE|nr:hypothetical protein AAFF_G00424750 [Aldrovandia affinis]
MWPSSLATGKKTLSPTQPRGPRAPLNYVARFEEAVPAAFRRVVKGLARTPRPPLTLYHLPSGGGGGGDGGSAIWALPELPRRGCAFPPGGRSARGGGVTSAGGGGAVSGRRPFGNAARAPGKGTGPRECYRRMLSSSGGRASSTLFPPRGRPEKTALAPGSGS